MLPKVISLVSIVLQLGWMFYFIAGGLPLLVLKYDHPSDARLIRGFFDVHYLVLMSITAVGTLGNVFSNRTLLATAVACIGLVGFAARRTIVPRMDLLRETITAVDYPAIRKFRTLHVTGIVLNVFMLAGFISALVLSSANMVSCSDVPVGCQGQECRTQCSLL